MSANRRMIRLRLLALLVFILGLPRVVMAVSPSTPISQYVHTAWRLEDGLLNGSPRAIAQTSDGYIWISTDAGVLRFDGVRFVPLADISPIPLSPIGDVWSLLGASDGSLWMGGTNRLYRWDGSKLLSFGGGGWFGTILEDRSRKIWAIRSRVRGEREGGLCTPVGDTVTCVGGESRFYSGYAATLGSDDAIWSANGQSLFRFASGNFSDYQFHSDRLRSTQGLGGVQGIASDFNGGVWVGFDISGPGLGLQHLIGGRLRHVQTSTLSGDDLAISVLLSQKNGSLWVGTGGGILRITDVDVERYGKSDGLTGNSVIALYADREGDLWVLTDKGIDRFRDASVISYTTAQRLSSDGSVAALATHDGSIWTMAADGADILRGRPLPRLSARVHLPGSEATSLLQTLNGDMWLGMDNDLYRISKRSVMRIRAKDGASLGIVGRMAQDKQGNLWISTFKMQVDGTILSVVRPNELVAQHIVTDLGMSDVTMPDVKSGIWILDRSGKIAHVDIGKVEAERNELLKQKHPLGLAQGADGTLYVWCTEGVLLMRGAKGRFFPDTQLASCQVHESVFDLSGDLWIRGKCGLIRVQKSEVEDWWNHPNAARPSRLLLEEKDGFHVSWGNFSPTLSRAPDGKLWLASDNGLQMVDPAHLYFNSKPPPVVIESMIANHLPVPKRRFEHLAAGTRDIEINYTGLSFSNPAKVLFRYKLDGHDKDWEDVGTRRQAFYTNLAPGSYTFHVKACNDSGVWNEQGASLMFSIEPAWYQTLWFHFVSVVMVVCLLAAAYRIRANVIADRVELRVNERMSERMRISRELHDTLLQALQGIVLRFSSLTTRVSADVQEEMDRSLDDAELLVIAGRERIKEMRGTVSEDGNITSNIQEFVTSLFASQGCKVIVEANGHPIPLNPISHEEILWIAREALTNSCRHSSAAHLTVQVNYTPRHFRLLMEDDGVGLPSDAYLAHYRGHFGLVSMRERADAIGGRFSVRSKAGQGTKVSLSLPARLAYTSKRWWLRDVLARRFRKFRT